MIAPHIVRTEMIIQREAPIPGETGMVIIPNGFNVGQVTNRTVHQDTRIIIQMKRAVEGIGIDDDAKYRHRQQG